MFGLATWGARWSFGEPVAEELDPDLLMWWLHRRLDTTNLPRPRFIVFVPFTDHPRRYWIVVEDEASICLADPGFDVDVILRTDRQALYRAYLGRNSLNDAQRCGEIDVAGSKQAVRALFDAFQQSPVAQIVAASSARHPATLVQRSGGLRGHDSWATTPAPCGHGPCRYVREVRDISRVIGRCENRRFIAPTAAVVSLPLVRST